MELLDLGKKPVSDASPAGKDARYEPEYDELQQEVDKLTSVTGGIIDWKHVAKLCSAILLNKSKDMKVASYLGAALIQLKGVEGLSVSTQILLDLVTEYWDTMYPAKKRMRGRFSAVKWWAENAQKFLQNYDGPDLSKDDAELLTQRLVNLDQALSETSEEAPALHNLLGYVDRLPVEAGPEETAEPDEQSGSGDAPSGSVTTSTPSTGPAAVGNINSADECSAELKSGLSYFSAVSAYMLANDLPNFVGYRVRRLSSWMLISVPPPAQGGKTMIPPPDSSVKSSIEAQLAAGDFSGAVQAAESRVGEFLFWLDLSRFTAEALEGMGSDYADAKKSIELDISHFVGRLNGLEALSFSDGTPFADAKTKSWLRSMGKSSGQDSSGSSAPDSESAKVLSKASELVNSKKLFDAVSLIQDSYNRTPSLRDSFLLRLGLIGILTDMNQSGLAHVHVMEVLDHIEHFNLENWEPDLALNGLKAVYEALIAEGSEDSAALAVKTLQRLGRISPADALKINGLN
ncbi:type VI secretion system protein TssA [Maridesulfovibrio zosterae]|uniref:type VI secretion system protein TssA n=1 Tax=Maridesulfovibrio zosterae TaxID=82171 RepID=UPI0003FD5F82|nr:type VI secretion system protein TssA [Maridesulfovibrio zosterae]